MTVWIALAVGILIGWIIEWVIDWLYWRRNLAAFYATETQLRGELAAAQAQITELTAANHALQVDLDDVRSSEVLVSPAVMEAAVEDSEDVTADSATDDDASADDDASSDDVVANADTLDAVLAAAVNMALAADTSDPEPDDLTKVSGIGPVYRRKLHEAGFYSFGQLAAANPDQLDAAIAPEGFQKPAYDQWIADAGKLATDAEG